MILLAVRWRGDSPLPFPDSGMLLRGIGIDRFNSSRFLLQGSRLYLTLILNQLSGFEFPFLPDAC
jgi:hypothetical protein